MTSLASYIHRMTQESHIHPSALDLRTTSFSNDPVHPCHPVHATIRDIDVSPPIPPMGWIQYELHQAILSLTVEQRKPLVLAECAEEKDSDGMQKGRTCWFLDAECVAKGRDALTGGVEKLLRFIDANAIMKIPFRLDGEKRAVFAHPRSAVFSDTDTSTTGWTNRVFDVDRSASSLWGMCNLGTTLIAYEGTGREIKIWIGIRGRSKDDPLGWDFAASGAIAAGMTEYQGLLSEAEEEAGFGEDLIESRVKLAHAVEGVLSRGSGKPFKAYKRWIWEMQLDPQAEDYQVPHCQTDEVEEFKRVTPQDIIDRLVGNEGTTNGWAIWIWFLYKHGIIADGPEMEKFLKVYWSQELNVVARPCQGATRSPCES